MNCRKMLLAAAFCPDPLGSYRAPPDLLTVIRKRGWRRRVGNRERKEGAERT